MPFAGYEETYRSQLTQPVSVLVPAHNESAGIVQSVQAMLALRYPVFEVIVVDDGSTDDTFERLADEFDLVEVPRVMPDSDTDARPRCCPSTCPGSDRSRSWWSARRTAARPTPSTPASTSRSTRWSAWSTPTRCSTRRRCCRWPNRSPTTRRTVAAGGVIRVATVRAGSSVNGFATDSSACGSSTESASTMQTRGYCATLMPVFTASVLPPFALRTTTRGSGRSLGTCTDWMRPRVGVASGTTRGTSTRPNSCRSRWKVLSVDPSSMTMTSNTGYRSASIAWTDCTIPADSLCAGTSTDTGWVSGLR